MPLDFTFAEFEAFCERAAHMPVFTLADYLSRSAPPPRPYLIFRVDVDYREAQAVQMARIADRYDLRGSFYFRHHPGGFDLTAMYAVAGLGHEAGYHFETLDTCHGDFAQAEALFLDHLAQLRAAHLDIRTVASHGGPPTAPNYQANYDLFTHAPDLFTRANVLGETTLSLDFTTLTYISDAGWRWRVYDAYGPGAAGKRVSLRRVIEDLVSPQNALVITFHSHQWFVHPAMAMYYRSRNRVGQVMLPLLRTAPSQDQPGDQQKKRSGGHLA